jgi:hypothetical protein
MTLIPLQSPTQRKLTRDAKRRKFTEEAAPGFPPIPTATPQPADEPFLTFAARPESPGSQTPFESGRLPQGFVQKESLYPFLIHHLFWGQRSKSVWMSRTLHSLHWRR